MPRRPKGSSPEKKKVFLLTFSGVRPQSIGYEAILHTFFVDLLWGNILIVYPLFVHLIFLLQKSEKSASKNP